MKRVTPPSFIENSRDLLLLLGEELKQPLVAISQLAELASGEGVEMRAYAQQALRTIDNVLLYQKINSGQLALRLEPVHIGGTLHEVMHDMQPLLKTAGCRTEIHIQHGLQPVDVDRQLFKSALMSLWQAILSNTTQDSSVQCHVRKSASGIRLSVSTHDAGLQDISFSQINTVSSQPITSIAGAATDLLTARGMFELLGARLSKSSVSRVPALGVTLQASRQLELV